MQGDAIVAIQDMGAAGLTSSSVEMAGKGGLGIELDLDRVPVRETGMTAYEIMLSESQERMLMVLRPGSEAEARRIFEKWELDFAVIGQVTDTGRLVLRKDGETVAEIPVGPLVSEAPLYQRPWRRAEPQPEIEPAALPDRDPLECLRQLIGCAGARLEALDLGAVRPPGDGRHGQAARRRRRGDPGRREKGAGALDRLHPALLPGRPGARRDAGGGRKLAQPQRGRRLAARPDRLHEFRQPRAAARSWASSSARSKALPRPLGARLSGRLRQCVALQRNQRQGDPAHPRHRRRRARSPMPPRRSIWR